MAGASQENPGCCSRHVLPQRRTDSFRGLEWSRISYLNPVRRSDRAPVSQVLRGLGGTQLPEPRPGDSAALEHAGAALSRGPCSLGGRTTSVHSSSALLSCCSSSISSSLPFKSRSSSPTSWCPASEASTLRAGGSFGWALTHPAHGRKRRPETRR